MKLWAKKGFEWAEDGLVGLWSPVNTGATGLLALDGSNFANHGTANGYANISQPWAGSDFGTVLDFDGTNDYVNCGNVLNFERTDSFTIAAWIRVASVPTYAAIVTKMTDAPDLRGWFFAYEANRRLSFILRNTVGNRIFVQTISTAFSLNTWAHVVVTYNGSSQASGVTLFSNGVSQAFTTLENTLTATTVHSTALTIGARALRVTPDGFMIGRNAETAIWNRALTASEIQTLYEARPDGVWQREPRRPRSYFAQPLFKNYWFRQQQHMIGGGIR